MFLFVRMTEEISFSLIQIISIFLKHTKQSFRPTHTTFYTFSNLIHFTALWTIRWTKIGKPTFDNLFFMIFYQ